MSEIEDRISLETPDGSHGQTPALSSDRTAVLRCFKGVRGAGAAFCIILFALSFTACGRSTSKVPDLSGQWEYTCTSTGTQIFEHGGFQHGGTVKISQDQEDFGTRISITGERQWIKKHAENGKDVITNLQTAIPWGSTEGSFTGQKSIAFSYETNGNPGALQGFVRVNITQFDGGKPIALEGTFIYQLPQDKILWGQTKLRRMKDDADYVLKYEIQPAGQISQSPALLDSSSPASK
ncbi:MAG TPA: hypothetical protein VI685_13980 [Candidatus Angelobacter sp.]